MYGLLVTGHLLMTHIPFLMPLSLTLEVVQLMGAGQFIDSSLASGTINGGRSPLLYDFLIFSGSCYITIQNASHTIYVLIQG